MPLTALSRSTTGYPRASLVTPVEISAHSITLSIFADKPRAHYQKLEFFNSHNQKIGEVMVQLDRPMAALAIGDCSELDGFQAPPLPPPAPAVHRVSQVAGS